MVCLIPFMMFISSAMALPMDEIEHFSVVYETIKQIYVDEIDEKTLMNYAIEGLIQKLDPHSDYLAGTAAASFEQATEGQFGGLGFELSLQNGGLEIMTISSDSPAEQAQLESHDMILMIDNTLTQGMSLREASAKIRGPIGSTVTLTILPAGAQKPIHKVLERALIKNPSIQARMIDEWGYIHINVFSQETTSDFIHALNTHMARPIPGLILDLRNNPGGLLKSGVAISNAFLDEAQLSSQDTPALVVSAKGRSHTMDIQEYVTGPDITQGLPVVVLINQGSASAAEIVAGALQDYGRAIVVGETSFGKGSVQTLVPIENNWLKMTCARYYTPTGRSIQASGIIPDIMVTGRWVEKEEPAISVSEHSLNRHLDSLNDTITEVVHEKNDLKKSDPILEEGLRILKALSIQSHKV